MSELHVVLTYFRNNMSEVNQLHDDLVRHGFEVWRDDTLPTGLGCKSQTAQTCKTELRRAIQSSVAIVVCFSEDVQQRDASGMFPELRTAIEVLRKMGTRSTVLIPVRFSACRIPGPTIGSTPLLSKSVCVDLFPAEERANGLTKLINMLSQCPQLKRWDTPSDLPYRQAFRVGEGADPIDDSMTMIAFKGTADKMNQALAHLQDIFNGFVSEPYDHGNDEYEVMIFAPVGSAQVSILAERCGIEVQFIDHVPMQVYCDFAAAATIYLASD